MGLLGARGEYMKVKNIEKFWGEKEWVKIEFDTGQVWVPAFDDLGKILFLIGQCEDSKYPRGEGAILTKDFIIEAILGGMTYKEFCESKQIPLKL